MDQKRGVPPLKDRKLCLCVLRGRRNKKRLKEYFGHFDNGKR